MMVGGTLKGCQTIDKWLCKYNYIIEIIYFIILPNIWSFAILIEVKQDEPKELYSIRRQMWRKLRTLIDVQECRLLRDVVQLSTFTKF